MLVNVQQKMLKQLIRNLKSGSYQNVNRIFSKSHTTDSINRKHSQIDLSRNKITHSLLNQHIIHPDINLLGLSRSTKYTNFIGVHSSPQHIGSASTFCLGNKRYFHQSKPNHNAFRIGKITEMFNIRSIICHGKNSSSYGC